MNEDGYWVKRVLTKLYSLYLDGELHYEASYWDCDWSDKKTVDINIENCKKEIIALEKLSNIGVIKVDLVHNSYKEDPMKQGVVKKEVRYLDYLPLLAGFNYGKFAEECRLIGFIPGSKTYQLPRVEADLGNGFRVHDRNIISYQYEEIKLAPQTAKVIACIMRNSKENWYTTKEMLIDEVYHNSVSENPEAEIRRVVSETRRIIQSATGNHNAQFFHNKRGIGYIFKPE